MNVLGEVFSQDFARRALLGAVLTGFTNGYVGTWVVLRRMVLTTEAFSHAMFPGLAIAVVLAGFSPLALFSGGLIAALLVVVSAEIITTTSRLKRDSAVGPPLYCRLCRWHRPLLPSHAGTRNEPALLSERSGAASPEP
jgi:ABC-type Mn2+/Zn2+ transport system permease subunit